MENDLDTEFKRYLQIMRPYLEQLIDQDIISICNAWIQKLTNPCSDKSLRNKYIFTLCYQLAKGELDRPFLIPPPKDELPYFSETESLVDEGSSTEVECLVIDPCDKANVWVNPKIQSSSDIDYLSREEDVTFGYESSNNLTKNKEEPLSKRVGNDLCNVLLTTSTCKEKKSTKVYHKQNYEDRTNNVILKLRELKKQNLLLNYELSALRDQSKYDKSLNTSDDLSDYETKIEKTCDISTNTLLNNKNIDSLKRKIIELQESKTENVKLIINLQNTIHDIEELKRKEIYDLIASHKIELIKLKTNIYDEAKKNYDEKLEELRCFYDSKISEQKEKFNKDIDEMTKKKNQEIQENELKISDKDAIIKQLENTVLELKNSLQSLTNKLSNLSQCDTSAETTKEQAQLLEKRLQRMEKSKNKTTKLLENKLVYLQREKQFSEYSLQLQLVKQRAHIIAEVVEEKENELKTALNKLETKYKDIVATVQAAAIKRRVRDQMVLETILQATYKETNSEPNRQSYKIQNSDTIDKAYNHNPKCDVPLNILHDKEEIISVNTTKNGSLDNESQCPKYYLNNDRLFEFYDKILAPQRDISENGNK